MKRSEWLIHLMVFVAGLMFAVGLGIAGMTQPTKVIAFLDVAGKWDATLLVVLGMATGTTFVMFRFIFRRQNPLLVPSFSLPTRSDIDIPLVAGSALFGIGWGLGGFCPGPALVAAASGMTDVYLFLLTMAIGNFGYAWINRPKSNPTTTPSSSPASA